VRTFDPANNLTRFAPNTAHFKKRADIEASAYLRDDRLTNECVVTVIKEARVITEPESSPRIEVPPSDIAAHFGKLLEDGVGCDVTFRVRGEAISAHRFVQVAGGQTAGPSAPSAPSNTVIFLGKGGTGPIREFEPR
jgi:speckle-type POZ protein